MRASLCRMHGNRKVMAFFIVFCFRVYRYVTLTYGIIIVLAHDTQTQHNEHTTHEPDVFFRTPPTDHEHWAKKECRMMMMLPLRNKQRTNDTTKEL